MNAKTSETGNKTNRSRGWKISPQGYIPILVLATFGILTTWALVQEVSRLESERVRTGFTAAARDRILVVQRELESCMNVVQDIGSFFDASHQVRRGQFREFVQPVLKRDPSIQSLEWVPEVPAEKLDAFLLDARVSFPRFEIIDFEAGDSVPASEGPHYPLLYAHPYQRDVTPLGLDLATVPEEFPALQRTRDLKSMQITYGANARRQDSTMVLNVYLPVFKRDQNDDERFDYSDERPDPPESRPGQLRGVAIGRFRIADIVNRALSNLSPSGIDTEIRYADPGGQTKNQILYFHRSRLRSVEPIAENPEPADPQTLMDTIQLAGNQLQVVCTAVPGIFRPSDWSARFVFAGGMAFTLLLAAYLVSLIGGAEKVASLVSQRTLELQHSNLALNRQVGERLKAEKALQALNATLEHRVALRAAEAERRAGELEQFAYVTSHDLKAPLRAIANLAKWLEEDLAENLTGETREQLQLMRDRVGRMHSLIEGLLTYSRVGRTDGELEQVDCVALVAEVVDSIAPPRGFDIDIAADLPDLYTDRLQLSQVFSNLISNSIKHHHRKQGRIRISGRNRGSFCEFTVADDGPGIPVEYHGKVFKMFQTLQVKDYGSDTGIGLALVKKIVEEHGGSISLKSELGAGAEISFTWMQTRAPKTKA